MERERVGVVVVFVVGVAAAVVVVLPEELFAAALDVDDRDKVSLGNEIPKAAIRQSNEDEDKKLQVKEKGRERERERVARNSLLSENVE